MRVLMVVATPESARNLVAWSHVFSDPVDELEFICLEAPQASEIRETLQSALSPEQLEKSTISSITGTTPLGEIMERIRKSRPGLLITGHFSFPTFKGRPQTTTELIRAAPCMAIYSYFGAINPDQIRNATMILSQGAHDLVTLEVAERVRQLVKVEVTLATVEEETSSKADRAGEMAIQTLVHDADVDEESFTTKVVVDPLRHRGIQKCLANQDLVILGFDGIPDIRPLKESFDNKMVLIVKRNPPLRLRSVADWMPRITPRDHAELLQDLRQGSLWNNDFVSMLALASAIATLGLLQNSPAVVIGSMLLAPLMTPMIGTGLALAQSNIRLAQRCAKTIGLGILLAFSISFLVGWFTPARETLPPEVLSRGTPNVLDLLIALFAAVAATIAMARPNISGAIAGVAIATALVPPLCATGISASAADFGNAVGALTLFATNLVAIIVASSFTFSLLGIVSARSLPRSRRIISFTKWGLVALLLVLAGPLSFSLLSQLEKGRAQTAVYPVTRAVSRALKDRVAQDDGVEVTFMGRSSVMGGVVIQIAADRDLPLSYANDLRRLVRYEMADESVPVFIVCLRGQWLSSEDVQLESGQDED